MSQGLIAEVSVVRPLCEDCGRGPHCHKSSAGECPPVHQQESDLRQITQTVGHNLSFQTQDLLRLAVAQFESDPELPGVLVVEGEKFIAALSRNFVSHQLSQAFYRELFLDKPISRLIEARPVTTLEVRECTPISAAIQQAMGRPTDQRYEPLVICTLNGKRYLLDIHAMLEEQCRVLATALADLERQRQATQAAVAEREQMHQRLVAASRQAGMAEIASGILHNVGNVLNSVTVSTNVITDKLRQSKVANLGMALNMLQEHQQDLATFLTADEKGRRLPGYLGKLSDVMVKEQETMLQEINSIGKSIDHITHIVHSQQAYATGAVAAETFMLTDVIEDALKMNALSFGRHGIEIVRAFQTLEPLTTDKHLVMQILVNLVSNARLAARDCGKPNKSIRIEVEQTSENNAPHARVRIIDNGVGIAPENLARIFSHGFTTRQDGHGVGLHNSANAAKQLGGWLRAESAGVGCGATFTLLLPYQTQPVGGVQQ